MAPEHLITNVDPTALEGAARLGTQLLGEHLDPLQAARCDGIDETYMNATCHGDFIGVGTGVFFDAMGPVFPLMLALIFLPSSYVLAGNLSIPLTIIVFIGTMVAQFLPAPFAFLGVVVVAIGIGVAIFVGIHRLRRES